VKFTTLLIVAASALSIPSLAQAEKLKVTVAYGSFNPGVVETFDIDTSVIGTLSASSAAIYGTAQDADFVITHDSLSHTLLQIGDSTDYNYFATGTSDAEAFSALYNFPGTFTQSTSAQFFDGSSLYFQASIGETAIGLDGTSITVSSGVPEPSTWAMMIAGFGIVGAMSMFGQRRKGAAIA
jgi:hypothetical protein